MKTFGEVSSAEDGSSMVGFTPRPLYHCGIRFHKRLGEFQRGDPDTIKLRFHGRLAYSLVSNVTFNILTKTISWVVLNLNHLDRQLQPLHCGLILCTLFRNRTKVRAYLKQICYCRMKPLLSSSVTYKHVVGRLAQWYQLLEGRRRASRRVRQVQ